MTNKFGKISALREHMLDGHKVSRLESMVMFGVSNLPVIVSGMKKNGFLIKSQKTNMISILQRMKKYAICIPPKNLPTKEIFMIEYWVSK